MKPPLSPIFFLLVGIIIGLGMVLYSIAQPRVAMFDVEENALAKVNNIAITRTTYLNYLAELSVDKQAPISDEDSKYILEKMIEEELLVQRGIEVQLYRNDGRIRASLVDAMVNLTTRTQAAKPAQESELREFYKNNAAYFSATTQLQIQQILFKGEGALIRAEKAISRLKNGDDYIKVNTELGNTTAMQVPDSLLPEHQLIRYFGISAIQQLSSQSIGYISPPSPYANGYRILLLKSKLNGNAPEFELIRKQIEAEYARRRENEQLTDYLIWLKSRADIQYTSGE